MISIARKMTLLLVVMLLMLIEKSELKEAVIFRKSGEVKIEDGNIVTTLSTLGKTFSVSFQIKVFSSTEGDVFSLFHFDTEANYGRNILELVSTRDPFNDNDIILVLDVQGKYHQTSHSLCYLENLLNKWSKIRISQDVYNDDYVTKLEVDGKNIIENLIEGKDPRHFRNITVYAAKISNDKLFRKTIAGSIKNIEVRTEVVAPCSCLLEIKDTCLALNKDAMDSQGKCYSEKLLSDISYLDKTKENLVITKDRLNKCQIQLRQLLPTFIDEYDECAFNIHYLKRLQTKLEELKNDYGYLQKLFGDFTKKSGQKDAIKEDI